MTNRRRRAATIGGWIAISLIVLSFAIDKLAGQLVILVLLVGAIGLFVFGRAARESR